MNSIYYGDLVLEYFTMQGKRKIFHQITCKGIVFTNITNKDTIKRCLRGIGEKIEPERCKIVKILTQKEVGKTVK